VRMNQRARKGRSQVLALLAVLPSLCLFAATDCLARSGANGVAESLCRLGMRWFPDVFRAEMAYVRCFGGDLEGGLRLLQDVLPGNQWAFFRSLHSGLMCQHHKQNDRAAGFFEHMLSVPDPGRINPRFRPGMEEHIARLRSAP
jgi:hypothetical protein